MMNLFKKPQQKVQKRYSDLVPSGLIANTEKGYFYIKGKKRFKFVSERAMLSWNLSVINTIEEKMAGLLISGTLGFRDGSLIKDISDGKMYLISDSKRRHIIDPSVLEWINGKIIDAGQKEVLIHEEGEPLDGYTS